MLILCAVSILVFVLAAFAQHLLPQLSYSLRSSLADFGNAFSGADTDVLARAARTFAEIGGSLARMQGSKIAGAFGSTFAQALRSLACAFANVLTTLADFLARAWLNLLVLIRLHRLLLGSSLILGRIYWAGECGPHEKQNAHRCNSRSET